MKTKGKIPMKTSQTNNDVEESTYALLVGSEDKKCALLETIVDDGFWFGLDPWYYPYDDYYAYDDQDYYGYDASTDPYSVPMVSAVQSDLAREGYYRGVIDGVYGPQTRVAITRYQSNHGLQVTGSLTTATLQSLGIGS
jgi:hypothetical protein